MFCGLPDGPAGIQVRGLYLGPISSNSEGEILKRPLSPTGNLRSSKLEKRAVPMSFSWVTVTRRQARDLRR